MMDEIEEDYKTESLGHLGLVAATIKKLGIIDKINHRLPLATNKGGKISHGHRAAAMLLNGLGYINRTLYLSPYFFEDKPLDLLLDENITYNDLNDDMLGRHLDAIAEYGPTKLFSEITYEICAENNLLNGNFNLDTTTLTLSGEYEGYEDASPQPMLGYSKDHRPDLKQITVTLTQVSEANIPIWFEALDGNSSDKKSFQETVSLIKEFQASLKEMPNNIPFIVDAAFYTPKSLQQLSKVTWLTRVPATYNEAKMWLHKSDSEINWVKADENNKLYAFEITHEGIAQRWALVDSKKGRAKATKTFFRQLDKAYDKHSKALWHLGNQTFSCENDLEKSLEKLSKQLKHHQLHYEIIPVMKHAGRGRPKQEAEAVCIGYTCEARLSTDLIKVKIEVERLGRFILATNELDSARISDLEILSQYKSQAHVERGFRFLKSDEFELNHIYLKNPNRIGALMMLMTLCLVVYNFAQYQLRQALKQQDTVVPNQLGKPVKNPTLRWIYQLLSTISVLCLWDEENQRWVKKICNLKRIHKVILYHYGSEALKIYGLSSSMMLPDYDRDKKPLMQWL
jgi:transposase